MYNIQENISTSYAGIPYEDINWYDIAGQPFGIASYFNAIIFGDANNIVDTKGAFAVGRDFVSSRGLTLAFGNKGNLLGTGYNPDFVRFLVGRNVAMEGPLVVAGHVVAGGNFRAASGSTYMIGKDGTANQIQELQTLYQAPGGSQYWIPSDRGTHYAVSSYDVPRYIPAGIIAGDVAGFFNNGRESIEYFHNCITSLKANGEVIDNFHEKILRGNDLVQNVFVIDVRPNGILNKEIRFEIPNGSIAIVIFRTGSNAHLQYGLWGSENLANRTLYVFEDATNIYMEVAAAIWGSILAPNAMLHGHQTGGHVSGNVALGAFAVNARSGFEFHLYPFRGGVICEEISSALPEVDTIPIRIPPPPRIPAQPQVAPAVPQPVPMPMPSQPLAESAPCPLPEPCPESAPCPLPEPCPETEPCPEPEPCPETEPCPEPAPCPLPEICPPCPICQPEKSEVEYRPYPVRVPSPCPSPRTRVIYRKIIIKEKNRECSIIAGKIFGCIWGCACSCSHNYLVKLYKVCDERKILLNYENIGPCGCFEFKAPYDDCYVLEVCPEKSTKKNINCKPMLTLKNVGVSSLKILN